MVFGTIPRFKYQIGISPVWNTSLEHFWLGIPVWNNTISVFGYTYLEQHYTNVWIHMYQVRVLWFETVQYLCLE